jgi:hypothetical protein
MEKDPVKPENYSLLTKMVTSRPLALKKAQLAGRLTRLLKQFNHAFITR